MKKSLFYLFLISSFLLSPIQAKPEFVFYPLEKSETFENNVKETKEAYNGLEKKIINYADVLKNPVGEIKYARMQNHSVLIADTENSQEKEGTIRVNGRSFEVFDISVRSSTPASEVCRAAPEACVISPW